MKKNYLIFLLQFNGISVFVSSKNQTAPTTTCLLTSANYITIKNSLTKSSRIFNYTKKKLEKIYLIAILGILKHVTYTGGQFLQK